MAAQPVHVDISEELQDWQNARYGREVRSANVSALTKLQKPDEQLRGFRQSKGE